MVSRRLLAVLGLTAAIAAGLQAQLLFASTTTSMPREWLLWSVAVLGFFAVELFAMALKLKSPATLTRLGAVALGFILTATFPWALRNLSLIDKVWFFPILAIACVVELPQLLSCPWPRMPDGCFSEEDRAALEPVTELTGRTRVSRRALVLTGFFSAVAAMLPMGVFLFSSPTGGRRTWILWSAVVLPFFATALFILALKLRRSTTIGRFIGVAFAFLFTAILPMDVTAERNQNMVIPLSCLWALLCLGAMYPLLILPLYHEDRELRIESDARRREEIRRKRAAGILPTPVEGACGPGATDSISVSPEYCPMGKVNGQWAIHVGDGVYMNPKGEIGAGGWR